MNACMYLGMYIYVCMFFCACSFCLVEWGSRKWSSGSPKTLLLFCTRKQVRQQSNDLRSQIISDYVQINTSVQLEVPHIVLPIVMVALLRHQKNILCWFLSWKWALETRLIKTHFVICCVTLRCMQGFCRSCTLARSDFSQGIKSRPIINSVSVHYICA